MNEVGDFTALQLEAIRWLNKVGCIDRRNVLSEESWSISVREY